MTDTCKIKVIIHGKSTQSKHSTKFSLPRSWAGQRVTFIHDVKNDILLIAKDKEGIKVQNYAGTTAVYPGKKHFEVVNWPYNTKSESFDAVVTKDSIEIKGINKVFVRKGPYNTKPKTNTELTKENAKKCIHFLNRFVANTEGAEFRVSSDNRLGVDIKIIKVESL